MALQCCGPPASVSTGDSQGYRTWHVRLADGERHASSTLMRVLHPLWARPSGQCLLGNVPFLSGHFSTVSLLQILP